MKNNTLFHWISFSIILSAMGLLGYILYLLYFPFKPMEYKYTTLPILKKQVKRGEAIQFTMDYCRNTDIPTTVYRQFVNDVLVYLPTVESRGAKGCRQILVNTVIAPEALPSGKAHYEFSVHVKVNPLRTITYELRTEDFEIID